MNSLEEIFYTNRRNRTQKWKDYFEIYERHFARFRGKAVHILEIGVAQGGSLRMWRQYFGPLAQIYGLDVNPGCKIFNDRQIKILTGSQSDRNFLALVREQIPKLDILIDDGGHKMHQQIITFEELFDHIDTSGVYLCEDLHTSYRRKYGGGYQDPHSFVEYSKHLIDRLTIQVSVLTIDTFGFG